MSLGRRQAFTAVLAGGGGFVETGSRSYCPNAAALLASCNRLATVWGGHNSEGRELVSVLAGLSTITGSPMNQLRILNLIKYLDRKQRMYADISIRPNQASKTQTRNAEYRGKSGAG
ncbi:hypothetical protein PG984_010194 [Apiospora sp. TS-2023a]